MPASDCEISDGEISDGETSDGEISDGETSDGETSDGETLAATPFYRLTSTHEPSNRRGHDAARRNRQAVL
jgi:hypothetical protein